MTPYRRLRTEIQKGLSDYSKSHDMSQVHFYFRGHRDCSWKIEPSICRNAEEKRRERAALAEQITAKNWDTNKGLFENIAHLQHYGIHTRFLDFTTDADIAIFFGCGSEYKELVDGEVIVCAYDLRDMDCTDTIVISELGLLEKPVSVSDFVDGILNKYPEMLASIDTHFSPEEHLGLSILSWIDHGFMVTPSQDDYERIKAWNPRIYNQKGAFFVPGNKTEPVNPAANTRSIRNTVIYPEIGDIPSTIKSENRIMRFKIPKEEKAAILEELFSEKCISESFVYPK